jgi:hypothetical protein
MSCTGGDRDGEFALDSGDRNRRHLAGSPDHEGANLERKIERAIGVRQPPRSVA